MNIAIIGCGKIGSMFAKALATNHSIYLYNRSSEKAEKLAKAVKGKVLSSLKNIDIVILAVKPQDLDSVVDFLKPQLTKKQILISTLTSVTLERLHSTFGDIPIFRTMPNLALEVGHGVIGIADTTEHPKQRETISKLFGPLGHLAFIPEAKLNALSAVTGSGPAFVAVIVEAMIDAAITLGFNDKIAKELVLNMIHGSTHLLMEKYSHPAELKWDVASPAGITIAGLKSLEKERLRFALMQAFISAYDRANELEKPKS